MKIENQEKFTDEQQKEIKEMIQKFYLRSILALSGMIVFVILLVISSFIEIEQIIMIVTEIALGITILVSLIMAVIVFLRLKKYVKNIK
ncbi:hypothetical protein [Haploplasma axanthum]|uniref:Uncharacterized protein n=1 Tax=Haploplasma axanthum TaxID=29552 RepID=A0A449BD97_HAPAX|nr:hypothetical protein [Haploplasma axanthum]VEU80433.1 Uncharacterised protein [Haploplasma axanthum]